MCRPRRELSSASSLAKFGFDTAENEPCLRPKKKENPRLEAAIDDRNRKDPVDAPRTIIEAPAARPEEEVLG